MQCWGAQDQGWETLFYSITAKTLLLKVNAYYFNNEWQLKDTELQHKDVNLYKQHQQHYNNNINKTVDSIKMKLPLSNTFEIVLNSKKKKKT